MVHYVIQRTDQGGGYVTPSGSEKSYTKHIINAQLFTCEASANAERCEGNEVVTPVEIDQILNIKPKHSQQAELNHDY